MANVQNIGTRNYWHINEHKYEKNKSNKAATTLIQGTRIWENTWQQKYCILTSPAGLLRSLPLQFCPAMPGFAESGRWGLQQVDQQRPNWKHPRSSYAWRRRAGGWVLASRRGRTPVSWGPRAPGCETNPGGRRQGWPVR